MFARISNLFVFFFLGLLLMVAASPSANLARDGGDPPVNPCNTGPVECCNVESTVANPTVGWLLTLLGVVISDLTTVVGIYCSAVDILGGGTCDQQTLCCTNNDYAGLIVIGCSPITL